MGRLRRYCYPDPDPALPYFVKLQLPAITPIPVSSDHAAVPSDRRVSRLVVDATPMDLVYKPAANAIRIRSDIERAPVFAIRLAR
jgi:hypothetical protein